MTKFDFEATFYRKRESKAEVSKETCSSMQEACDMMRQWLTIDALATKWRNKFKVLPAEHQAGLYVMQVRAD